MAAARVCAVGGSGVGLSFRLPRPVLPGETLVCDALAYVNGGKASNQAIGAVRLGVAATIITALGRDPLGELAMQNLRDGGVDLDGVVIVEDAPTMVGALMVEPSGENSIVIAPGALATMDAATIRTRAERITSSSLCIVSLEIPLPAAREALRIAREAGVSTVLNPAPASSPDDMIPLLQLCDVVTPNETEARALTGESHPSRQAQALLDMGARTVVITLGSRGALIGAPGQEAVVIPAVPVPVVDTSGAGDAFNAALAVALTRGRTLRESAEFGCRAAALVVQAPAFVEALHMWDALEAIPS
jgi:ribokinase